MGETDEKPEVDVVKRRRHMSSVIHDSIVFEDDNSEDSDGENKIYSSEEVRSIIARSYILMTIGTVSIGLGGSLTVLGYYYDSIGSTIPGVVLFLWAIFCICAGCLKFRRSKKIKREGVMASVQRDGSVLNSIVLPSLSMHQSNGIYDSQPDMASDNAVTRSADSNTKDLPESPPPYAV
ncbi:uncharacterized protein LOC120325382 [Styela clava]